MTSTRFSFNPGTLRELLNISLPMVISQGAFAIMVFSDRLFLSLIDPIHMAAALGGGVASFFSISLFMGMMSYANALVAQYYGAGELEKCPRVVSQGILMTIVCLPILAIIAYYVSQLFDTMGHDPRQVVLEQLYYRVLMLGCFFNLVKAVIASYFAGIGRTRVVMISDLLGMLLNIPLSYLLIFGKFGFPELGIAGAAWCTFFSSAFALLVYFGFYLAKAHRERFQVLRSFHWDRGILRRYARLGFPSGLEMFMNVATFNLFLLMYQSYGIAHGAAAAIVFNWDMMSFVPMIGLNIGVISLIGRSVGASDMSQTNGVMTAGFVVALGYSSVLALLFVIFRVELVDVFAGSGQDFEEIRQISTFMMVGLACYMMADATILISGGVLRGAGDTRWLMVVSISLHWLMLVAQYLIIITYDYGAKVSWVVFVASIILIAVVYLWRLRSGIWRQPDRLAQVMHE